jgi:hypothetical protein
MAESGHILRMKLWTGYNYKYVMLTGLTTDKRPTEDDVFRVSMALREIPVLNVTKPSVSATAGAQGAAVLKTVDELKKLKILPLAKAVGVDTEMQKMK